MTNIEDMIALEDDPRQRSFLIVLNNINNSLVANTRTITEVSEKLDNHLTMYEQHTVEESEILNKGRGAWKVAAVFLSIAQALVIALGIGLSNDLKELHAAVNAGQLVDATTSARIESIEKRIAQWKP